MSQLGLGEKLQLRGWISRRQLHRALAQQRRYGGRLGTSLLEIGAVTEDQLLSVLADQEGVPQGPIDGLRELPLELCEIVPRNLARRRRILPLEVWNDSLRVAFEDPGDLRALDELSFVTTKRIEVVGLHEVRISEGLERLYGIECPPRVSRLLKELNRGRSRGNGTDHGDEELQETLLALPELPTEPEALPIPRNHQGKGSSSPPPAEAEGPAAPRLQVVELTREEREALERELDRKALAALPIEQRLLRSSRASQVGEALLDHLGGKFRRVALLRAAGGGLRGWHASGRGLDGAAFSELRIDTGQPSIFVSVHFGGNFYVGPLAPQPENLRFLSCWGEVKRPETCALIPLRSQQTTLCLVYVDTPHGASEIPVAELQELAARAVKAFENCILRNRLQSERGSDSV